MFAPGQKRRGAAQVRQLAAHGTLMHGRSNSCMHDRSFDAIFTKPTPVVLRWLGVQHAAYCCASRRTTEAAVSKGRIVTFAIGMGLVVSTSTMIAHAADSALPSSPPSVSNKPATPPPGPVAGTRLTEEYVRMVA